MAIYDPPQPMWKRVAAGTLDFALAFVGLGIAVGHFLPAGPHAPPPIPNATTHEVFSVSLWGTGLLVVLIVAYFVVLGRTGGTVFQRLFGMKRAGRTTTA